jgi:succinoglycan biosynthesis transport protein ExoP
MDDGRGSPRDVPAQRRGEAVADYAPPYRVSEYAIDDEREDDGFNVLHYWNLVVKYRWLLVASLVVGLAAGVVVTLLTKPIYRATATVQIDEEPPKVGTMESDRPAQAPNAEKFYQTQYELLKSTTLAKRVALNEDLANAEWFVGDDAMMAETKAGRPDKSKAREARINAAAELVRGNLRVEPVRLSRIVKVTYESPDPAIAALVANAVARNYIDWNLERRYNASAEARQFLEGRLRQTREALEASQRRGNQYAQENELITVGAGSADPSATGESLQAADLASINQQLAAATSARIQTEQRWRQAMTTPDLALPEMLTNPSAQTLKAARDAAWAEYQQNLKLYKPEFPTMVEVKRRIDALDQQVAAQANNIRQSLRTEYEIARKNEGRFQGEVNRRKSELLASQGKRVEAGFIDTDIATTKALYEAMLATYKEIGIAGAVGENNISIVDPAKTPDGAVKPQPARNLALFGMLGLAAGAAFAFMRDRLDTSIKVPEDIERRLGLPILGTIPVAAKEVAPAKALEDAKSAVSEAYYSVRTALQFSTEDGVPASLLVTSSRPAEGKSTSSLAIASGFARLGHRVLLVDGDMRDPSLHRVLGRDNGVGLSNLLAGGDEIHPGVQPTNYRNLSFLSSGPLPPNPAELLGGGKMRAFVRAATNQYDLVVIDGPPVMGLADAPQLASHVAGVVMVVESGGTNNALARAAVKRLQTARGMRLVGAILTKFDLKKAGYAYGHAYGSGYGYGYGYDYGVRPEPNPRKFRFLPSKDWIGGNSRKTRPSAR